MKVYHFTAAHLAARIQREGLTKGALLISRKPLRIDRSWRWLTVNPDWRQEVLEGTGRLPYRRDEMRLTFEIPDSEAHRVLVWTEVGPGLSREYATLSEFADPENWRLWRGDIPPSWLVAMDTNPREKIRGLLRRAGEMPEFYHEERVKARKPPGKAGAGSRAAEPVGSCWHNSVGMFMGDGAEKEV